jgi:hypothetical protein
VHRVGERFPVLPGEQVRLDRAKPGVPGSPTPPDSAPKSPAAVSSKRCPDSHSWCRWVHARPSRYTRPRRSRRAWIRCRARRPSATRSARGHKSGTASSARDGTRIAFSSPARCSRASRCASRRSVLIRFPARRGISAGATTSHATPNGQQQRCAAHSRSNPPRSRPALARITEPGHQTAHPPASWVTRSTRGISSPQPRIPTTMTTWATSIPRWTGPEDEEHYT